MNCEVLVVHTCNPSYSGGRDQKDGGSKPDRENSSRDSVSKKTPPQNKAGEWLKLWALILRKNPNAAKKKKKRH
jgi:hypothetical protein